jgi:carboxylesterase
MPERIDPPREAISLASGDDAVLAIHGLTGCPLALSGIAVRLHEAGFSVEVPLLPGHGETPEVLESFGWDEFAEASEAAYAALAARSRSVSIVGFSSGAALGAMLAIRHTEVLGLVSINGMFAQRPGAAQELADMLRDGQRFRPNLSDTRDPDAREPYYDRMPIRTLSNVIAGAREAVYPRLHEVKCPVLAVRSAFDSGSAPEAAHRTLCDGVSGPVEELMLENSGHMSPIDLDRDELEQRIVTFARRVAGRTPD